MCRPAGFALTVLALVGLPAVLLLLVGGVLVGGCTYYPTAKDVGGVRLQPEKGRAVRSPNAAEAAVYFVLNSTGKYGDVLLGAESPVVAKRAELRGPSGSRVSEIEIPGGSVVKFEPRGPRVVLSDFKRPLKQGEVIIVTLRFEKSGPIGVITVVE